MFEKAIFQGNSGRLIIEVMDTGIGISEENISKLFKKFSQVSGCEERKLGTGLGLWITKEIVEKMNGAINVTSNLERGSSFIIQLRTRICNNRKIAGSREFNSVECGRFKILIISKTCQSLLQGLIREYKNYVIQNMFENSESAINYYDNFVHNGGIIDIIIIEQGSETAETYKHVRRVEEKYSRTQSNILIMLEEYQVGSISEMLGAKDRIEFKPYTLEKTRINFDLLNNMAARRQTVLTFPDFHGKVLIVDDDFFNLKVMEGMARKARVGLFTANNGQEGFEIFQREKNLISIIFMDCEMPVLDGFGATKLIHDYCKQNKLRPPRIFGLTGHRASEVEKRALASGMSSVITKPLTFQNFSNILD
jgi:CheY-like chemotaxis protein